MKHRLYITLIAFLLCTLCSLGQNGTVKGVLTDASGLPMPGVNVLVKGTTVGTQTDFDGNYSIDCVLGDILEFTFVGYDTREVRVTASMFEQQTDSDAILLPVSQITTQAFADAIKTQQKQEEAIPTLESAQHYYNKGTIGIQTQRIRTIDIEEDKVQFQFFKPDVYYEIGYTNRLGLSYVDERHTPRLQNTYSQGAPVFGNLMFQGPESEVPFSYGPAMQSLEFDGSNYSYDTQGSLVPIGEGNGLAAKIYNNELLQTTMNHYHHAYMQVSTEHRAHYNLSLTHENARDLFDVERRSKNRMQFTYKDGANDGRLQWNASVVYQDVLDDQPNINGFINQVLMNSWITPVSFSNAQGHLLPNNSQRRFNSGFNNPLWLLQSNRNSLKERFSVGRVHVNGLLGDAIDFNANVSYQYDEKKQTFGLYAGTAGFQDGIASNKSVKTHGFNGAVDFEYAPYSYSYDHQFTIKAGLNYGYDALDFDFLEVTGLPQFSWSAPNHIFMNQEQRYRHLLKGQQSVNYEYKHLFELGLVNNSYLSSIQENAWFLPSFYTKFNLRNLLNMYGDLGKLELTTSMSFDVNDLPLYYSNQAHNSLGLLPSESLTYTANNDLFVSDMVALERKTNYEIGISGRLFGSKSRTDFQLNYYNGLTKDAVFPVLSDNDFRLENVADIQNKGFELLLTGNFVFERDFNLNARISLSTYRTKVKRLHHHNTRVPIAGFASTSMNLIKGAPAGVLVGTAYQRHENGQIVIDDSGFPLVNPLPQVIGDPTPDFNLGFTTSLAWKRFELQTKFDVQKGGDVWNGTENVLDYFGTSQTSAQLRTRSHFVFQGVNQQGETNTIPVDFYNPENGIAGNRFVRYGFEGVAEEAIEDASYINLQSVNLSYDLILENDQKWIRECTLGFYGKNLWTWTAFRGHNPYGALYGNATGQALNFFNTPLQTEIGCTLKIKI